MRKYNTSITLQFLHNLWTNYNLRNISGIEQSQKTFIPAVYLRFCVPQPVDAAS